MMIASLTHRSRARVTSKIRLRPKSKEREEKEGEGEGNMTTGHEEWESVRPSARPSDHPSIGGGGSGIIITKRRFFDSGRR